MTEPHGNGKLVALRSFRLSTQYRGRFFRVAIGYEHTRALNAYIAAVGGLAFKTVNTLPANPHA